MKTRTCWCSYMLAFAIVFELTMAKNILYLSTSASPSHNIWDKTLAMGLRNRGHTVTYATHSPEKSTDNFTAVIFEGTYDRMHSDFDIIEMNKLNFFQFQNLLYDWLTASCSYATETNGFKSLLKQAENGVKYDVIIIDITSGQCLYPIIDKFGSPPSVAVSAFGANPFLNDAYGISHQASYIPMYGLRVSEQMSFLERFYNYIATVYAIITKQLVYYPQVMEISRNLFGDDVKHVSVYEKNFSIFLANYDPVLSYPQPLPPAIIPVGGLHVKRANELPQDLKTYMDESKNGVIVFSLGTNIRSDEIGEANLKILLETFAELKQNVIWKFESQMKNIPKNVLIRKFLPQNDLLAHPNVKLLMNHGGGLSTQEGLYHGLPIIAMPFFADQESNTFEIVTKKLGLKLDFFKLNKEHVLSQINEVLQNEIYRQNSQKISQRYRNRPENALDRAVFWVEKVMREGGCDYLRIASRDMPFYQTEFLDIWAVTLLLLYFVIKIVCSLFSRKSSKKSKKD